MGVTDSKAISTRIDNEFKSIRKYHDSFYGQITLIEQKSNKKQYALVQKVIIKSETSLTQFLNIRKQFSPYLVRLQQYYSCSNDYCSGLQKYFFLLEYSQHTLYDQMALRQQTQNRFSFQQLFNIFSSYLQVTAFLRDKNKFFRSFISNHLVLYSSPHQLKTLETLLKVENDAFQQDFHLLKNNQKTKELYLPPQAYLLMCNKQRFEAKTVSLTQKSIVFMLGMNFIECALLADVSGVYSTYHKWIHFDRLQKTIDQLSHFYGEEIAQMISQMVAENPSDRPTIDELKEYMKTNLKRRKIIIPKHTKIQQLNHKQLHA